MAPPTSPAPAWGPLVWDKLAPPSGQPGKGHTFLTTKGQWVESVACHCGILATRLHAMLAIPWSPCTQRWVPRSPTTAESTPADPQQPTNISTTKPSINGVPSDSLAEVESVSPPQLRQDILRDPYVNLATLLAPGYSPDSDLRHIMSDEDIYPLKSRDTRLPVTLITEEFYLALKM